jgi:ABC-type lipoprotein release transport system permease subunit
VADARRILGELDPLLVLYQPRPLVEIIGDGVAQERFAMVLIAVFALLAVTLAAIGVYGVLAYTIARRRREIGIRLALGAPLAVVRRDVVIDGMRVTALGVILGLIVAAVATRWLSSLIYEVSVRDPIVFGSAAMVLTVIAFGAALHPARAATKVDPLAALRSE